MLVIDERVKMMARRVTEYLKVIGRFHKTIVLCRDVEHAERMRQALVNENADLVAQNRKYVMRITGDSPEGVLGPFRPEVEMEDYYQLIKQRYRNTSGDATELFHTVLSVADEIGLDRALAILEQCVIEKRLAWLDENLASLDRTGDPVLDGYRLFYESYLGISAPEDGAIIEQTDGKLVTRWWNHCPTLEACQKLGLDTREICRKVYHQPVQEFLSRVHPKLRFERDYQALRPHTAYCEESITLEE